MGSARGAYPESARRNGDLAPGTRVLDRYVVVKVLGRGAMGVVYLVQHRETEQWAAMKVLDGSPDDFEALASRFRREARAVGRVRSDYVVAIHDFDIWADGNLCLIMEYLEGETAHQALSNGALGLDRTRNLGLQMLEGLADTHAAGVIHRDLKPSNLFIERRRSGEERCKLIDFGLSKLANTTATQLTQTGDLLGTVGYMAPEQVQACIHAGVVTVDYRADLYSAGVCLFTMLLGMEPIAVKSDAEFVVAVLEQSPLTLREASGTEYPRDLEEFFFKALQKAPKRRFQCAAEMKSAFLHACNAALEDPAFEAYRATRPDGLWEGPTNRKHPFFDVTKDECLDPSELGIGHLPVLPELSDPFAQSDCAASAHVPSTLETLTERSSHKPR